VKFVLNSKKGTKSRKWVEPPTENPEKKTIGKYYRKKRQLTITHSGRKPWEAAGPEGCAKVRKEKAKRLTEGGAGYCGRGVGQIIKRER